MTFRTSSCFWQARTALIRQNWQDEAARFSRPQFAEGSGPRMRSPKQAFQPTGAQASHFRARERGRLNAGSLVGCLESRASKYRWEAPEQLGGHGGVESCDPMNGRQAE